MSHSRSAPLARSRTTITEDGWKKTIQAISLQTQQYIEASARQAGTPIPPEMLASGFRKGDVLVFPRELRFRDGAKLTQLTVLDPRRGRFVGESGRIYRIGRNTVREERYDIVRGQKIIQVNAAR